VVVGLRGSLLIVVSPTYRFILQIKIEEINGNAHPQTDYGHYAGKILKKVGSGERLAAKSLQSMSQLVLHQIVCQV
jgi:hypothetical protein